MSDVKQEYFPVTREDDCIWLKDLRENPPIEIHLVPEQALEVALNLLRVVESK